MSFISNRLSQISPSPTLEINAQVATLKASGVDIINLSGGELDFDVPPFLRKAAQQAVEEHKIRYTPVAGMLSLREAILKKFKRDNDLTYTIDQVIVGTGAKQILFNALLASLNKGDEVLIPAPYWVSYPDMVRIAEGTPIIIPCSSKNYFKLTAEALEKAITAKTKWLILNSPNNPTGAVYTHEEWEDIAEVVRRHPQIYILSDDIYEYLVFDDSRFSTLVQVAPDLKERVLLVNGISKSYASTGWRVGYGVGPQQLIQAMTALQSQSTSSACTIAQMVARAALEGPHDFLQDWIKSLKSKRDEAVERLNHIPGITCSKPQGAFYLYPSCQGIIGKTTPAGVKLTTDLKVTTYLLESVGVAVIPGEAFGVSPYFRLSYTVTPDVLREGCSRLKEAIERLT